ncbi:MAG TPA: type II secretion system secretin GspD [Gallionellaceae bacterium]|nr:type II secretion system secretin GspD [Gallionellaceae bacterium]
MTFFNNFLAVRITLPIIFLATLCISPLAISAQEEKVSLNFVNADIEEVIKAVSHITGRNFVVDPRVKGTINIISSTPVAAPLAYDILLSTLRMQGFAAVEAGGVTKVMPEADAKLYVSGVNERGTGEKLITRVYVLKYESAAQLVPVLRPLIAPNNIVVAYPNNNTLVVTDYASNMRRIEQIVNSIDQPGKGEPVIIPVKRASAVELAQTINRLLQDGAAGVPGAGTDSSARFVLLADSRTNSLLVRTENQDKLDRVRELVKKLDIKTGKLGNMHVVYLKNAEAVKLAQTLRAVLSGDTSAAAAAGAAATPASAGIPSAPTGSGAVGGGGMIQADASTNALIITATSNIYNNIRAVIDMLDVRRAQVFVEALIAEVSADKAAEFGIQWQGAGRVEGGGTQVGGGTNFGGAGTNIIDVGKSFGSATGPSVGTGLNIGIVRDSNLGALARALQTDSKTNILSTPNLTMLDNEEAKIIIGKNVPFITGSQQGTTANPNPFQTIERKDVGLILKIKPQISEGGTVKMVIFQEVSSVDDQSTNVAGLITFKRSLDTTVLVDDGQTLVLGGLIEDKVTLGESKVPLLGDIPLLGWLFRYETRTSNKTNLMIFIRPSILRTAVASQGLTQDRYQYLRDQQEQSLVPWHLLLPGMPGPKLPDLKPVPVSSLPATASAAPGSSPADGTEEQENADSVNGVENESTTPPSEKAPATGAAPAKP